MEYASAVETSQRNRPKEENEIILRGLTVNVMQWAGARSPRLKFEMFKGRELCLHRGQLLQAALTKSWIDGPMRAIGLVLLAGHFIFPW